MARNAVAHGVAICAHGVPGLTYPIRFPLRIGSVVWAPIETVLAGLSVAPSKSAQQLYEDRMSGQDVEPILLELVHWYEKRIPNA